MLPKRYLSIPELAKYIGVRKTTLYYWVYMNKMPHVKINGLIKFEKQEIVSWIDKNKFKINNT
ncbi:MAG: helix-turn-helix domain-containing protein [Candidatus Omnitrophica bacterium]|nr:helix-turn-helix domain-containing protein [Candidatus Omnitrophota bacterium]